MSRAPSPGPSGRSPPPSPSTRTWLARMAFAAPAPTRALPAAWRPSLAFGPLCSSTRASARWPSA
eukprot:15375699-Alexandrium_andersonii.AAC.1